MKVRIPAALEAAVGERVRLVQTNDEYTALRPGDEGVVTAVRRDVISEGEWVVDVDWDRGSDLSMLTAAGDEIEVVS